MRKKSYESKVISKKTTHYESLEFLCEDERFENDTTLQAAVFEKFGQDKTYQDAVVINPAGEKVKLADLMHIDAIPFYYARAKKIHHIDKQLEGDWFWACDLPQIPTIRIIGYSFDCYNTIYTTTFEFRHTQLPYYHIKDLSLKAEHSYNSLTKEFLTLV